MGLVPNPGKRESSSLTIAQLTQWHNENRAKHIYFKSVEKHRSKYYNYAYWQIKKAFEAQSDEVVKAVASSSHINDISRGVLESIKSEPIREAYYNIYKTVGVSFAKNQFRSIKKHFLAIEVKDFLNEKNWEDALINYVNAQMGKKITGIDEETRRYINIRLSEAHQDGLSVPDAAKKIQAEFEYMSRYRAIRIARTELIGASNKGSILGVDSAGVPMLKEWISTRDSRTRDDHSFLDGDREEMNGKFNVGGYLMDHPGDSNAPAEQIVNCRCTVGFVPIRTFIFEN